MINFFTPTRHCEYARFKRLYKSAFPRCERKPFSMIKKMHKGGTTDIWYFEREGEFLGLATTVNREDFVLIDYFAVSEEHRGQGNGTEMLRSLIDHYSPRGVFLEIEKPYKDGADYLTKLKRKEFYLGAGLCELGVSVSLFGVDMELMGTGLSLSFEEYRDFYLDRISSYAPRALFEKNIVKID